MLQRTQGLTLTWLTPTIRGILAVAGTSGAREKQLMLKAVILQFGATLLAVALCAVFFGVRGAISAAGGGLACVLPSWMFAVRLAALTRKAGTASVTAFVAGEFIKIASIVGLLVLVWAVYPALHWGALMIGLILALKANLFAFLVKT
jgi:ATP synthase protein I